MIAAGRRLAFRLARPDGQDYKNEVIYQEIVKPERIVFEHVSDPKFQVTATFADVGDQTRITFRMHTAAECNQVKTFADANEKNFDRLEAQLARMALTGDQS